MKGLGGRYKKRYSGAENHIHSAEEVMDEKEEIVDNAAIMSIRRTTLELCGKRMAATESCGKVIDGIWFCKGGKECRG